MSQRHDNLNGTEAELAEALGALQPAAPSGRDALLFAAGRRSARTGLWTWRGISAGLAAVLVAALLLHPGPEVRVETPVAQAPEPAEARIVDDRAIWPRPAGGPLGQDAPERAWAWNSVNGRLNEYLQLREAVLHRGWEALPETDRPGRLAQPIRPFLKNNHLLDV
jgi:hypothetical protein